MHVLWTGSLIAVSPLLFQLAVLLIEKYQVSVQLLNKNATYQLSKRVSRQVKIFATLESHKQVKDSSQGTSRPLCLQVSINMPGVCDLFSGFSLSLLFILHDDDRTEKARFIWLITESYSATGGNC